MTCVALLASLSTCLTYLCQQHHEPNLTSEEISEYALASAYTLHEFAATTWLELLEQYVEKTSKEEMASELISLLEILSGNRTNFEYEGESKNMPHFRLRSFKDGWPQLHDMLQNAAGFRHVRSTSQHKMTKGSCSVNCLFLKSYSRII